MLVFSAGFSKWISHTLYTIECASVNHSRNQWTGPIPTGEAGSIALSGPPRMCRSVSDEIRACTVAPVCRPPNCWPAWSLLLPPPPPKKPRWPALIAGLSLSLSLPLPVPTAEWDHHPQIVPLRTAPHLGGGGVTALGDVWRVWHPAGSLWNSFRSSMGELPPWSLKAYLHWTFTFWTNKSLV